ncbi:MAG: ABC transporter substrate-binding protein [Chloroflexi bacterium]|nr:ABC transporter substrate-binding protein [Chloroflexota bacterium]
MSRYRTSRARRRLLQGGLVLAGVGLLSGCGGLPLPGQQPARVPRIGYLGSDSPGSPNSEAFRHGLRELGYVETQNLVIEWRFAEGRDERLPALAAELLNLPVELILTAGPSATRVARDASRTLPIVMCFPGDPIGLGLIASLDRPGGNITGLASLTTELHAKRLELFAESLPGVSRVAVLWDANAAQSVRGPLDAAARSLKLLPQPVEVRGPEGLEGAIRSAVAGGAEALFLADSPMFTDHRHRIVELAASSKLPASGAGKAFVEAGALLSYSARVPDMYRRAASGVDKILKGANPADLPVERPPTFDFVINLTTARTLGLTIPESILLQVTEIIE